MKKVLLLVLLITLVISVNAQDKEQISEVGEKYQMYELKCKLDSTLYIFWEYTGQEKGVNKVDTINGAITKIITLAPTQRSRWVKETPSWKGFEAYLETLEKKEENE